MKRLITILLLAGHTLLSCTNSESNKVSETVTQDKINSKTNDTSATKIENGIDILIQQASNSGSPDDLVKVWKATLNLSQWHFISKFQNDIQNRKPYVGVIDNLPWVFVFTDRQKAKSYCLNPRNSGFTDNYGNVTIISMDTEKAIEYIIQLGNAGVFGVRFNEGNGWFSPIQNLPGIIKAYKKQ